MINYIIQVLLFQALFLAVYDFFLQKETFFKWNRVYLIVTPLISFLISFFKFESFQNTVPTEYVEQLPTVFLNPEAAILQTVEMQSSISFLKIVFYAGIALFLLVFLLKLYKVFQLIVTSEIIKKDKFKLVILTKRASVFSFFNYIFIKKELLEKRELAIIEHELIHCKQLHTLDLIYFEFLKIIMWFNPLIYVYQNRITLLHEYISDAEVIKKTNKSDYFNTLLSETFNVQNISFTNQFFKPSLIKKRITMITQNKSHKMKQLKYLLILPLLFGMLLYISCTKDSQTDIDEINFIIKNEIITMNGKYFEGKSGIKIFTGTKLNGQIVSYEEMTNREKEIYDNFKKPEYSKIEYNLIVEPNGDRVHFIKIPQPPMDIKQASNPDDVPFAIIDEVPVFPECEGTQEELRLCLQENITNHVAKYFNSNLANELGLKTGINKIFVMFRIDKEGKVVDLKARAPHKALEEEAIRVVSSLPQMTPGKQNGKVVSVKYSLPIAFKVE